MITLFYGPNSPFSRKCRIIILEKGIEDVKLIPVSATENPPELIAVNPLCTVPALITHDGLHLCDSSVICEYLDGLPSKAPKLMVEADARLCDMAVAVMAEGMMNAAVACVLENRRPQENQYPAWVTRKEAAVSRTIDKIGAVPFDFSRPLSFGMLNLAIALHYVSFRLPNVEWKSKYPALSAWADKMAKRPSFAATAPQA